MDREQLLLNLARRGADSPVSLTPKGLVTVRRVTEMVPDDKTMSVRGVITTQAMDRGNDIVVTRGLQTGNHQANPVVYFDHGMSLTIPIAKAEDPDGRYTVEIGDGEATSTTYFSQSLKEAEDLYGLVSEGILRGWSIGFRPLAGEFLPIPEEKKNDPFFIPGIRFDSVELLEYSLCGVPMNQEALTRAYYRDRNALSVGIKSAIHPYILPRNTQTTVPADVPGEKDDMPEETGKPESTLTLADLIADADEDDLAKLREALGMDDEEEKDEEDEDEEDEEDEEDAPPGAKALSGLFDLVSELYLFADKARTRQESPAVAEALDSALADVGNVALKAARVYAELYPDLEALDPCLLEEDADKDARAKMYERIKAERQRSRSLTPAAKTLMKRAAAHLGRSDEEKTRKLARALEKAAITSPDAQQSATEAALVEVRSKFASLVKQHQNLVTQFRKARRGR